MTPEQEQLLRDVEIRKISVATQNIRGQIASGVPIDTIYSQLSIPRNVEQPIALASLAVAEAYQLTLPEAYHYTPFVLLKAFGENYDPHEAIAAMYGEAKPFSAPIKSMNPTEARAKAGEDAKLAEAASAMGRMPTRLPAQDAMIFNPAAQMTAMTRSIQLNRVADRDADLSKFIEEYMMGDREKALDDRAQYYIDKQNKRLDELRTWEDTMKTFAQDRPTKFDNKLISGRRFEAKRNQIRGDVLGAILRPIGALTNSASIREQGKHFSDIARAYHTMASHAELQTYSYGALDDIQNAFVENAPYTALMAAAAIVSPAKLVPFVIFCGGFVAAWSNIRQSALDAGASEAEANARGALGGVLSGILESAGGGASKYTPKKLWTRLAALPKTITKTAITEIFMEEVPQQILETWLGKQGLPRTEDGDVDVGEVVDRYMTLARDTAVISVFFGSGSAITTDLTIWDANRRDARAGQAIDAAVRAVMEAATDVTTQIGTPEAATQPTAPVEGQTAPTPAVAPEATRVGGGTPPTQGLVVATIGADGKIYYGEANELHFSLSEKYGESVRQAMDLQVGDSTWLAEGFAGPDGKFLNREQALQYAQKTATIKPSDNMEGKLDAMDYREQKDTPLAPATTPVEAEAIVKQPWEMTREEYDRQRGEKLGLSVDFTEKNALESGMYDRKQKSVWRQPHASSGMFTHELRHAIVDQASKNWNELRNYDMTLPEAIKASEMLNHDASFGYDDLAFRRELKDEVASRIAHGDKSLAAAFPELAEIVMTHPERLRLDISLVPHKEMVRNALAAWKPVPAEVLAQYPDLELLHHNRIAEAPAPATTPVEAGTPTAPQPVRTPTEILATPDAVAVDMEAVDAAEATINEIVEAAPVYDLVREPDGKYTVINLETQHEIKNGLSEKKAKQLAAELTAGEAPITSMVREILPTSQDIETLTHTELLRIVFTKVSQQSQKIVRQVVSDMVTTNKSIADYAKKTLSKLDIPTNQSLSLLKRLAAATTDAERQSITTIIASLEESGLKAREMAKFKKLRSAINRKAKLRTRDGGIPHHAAERLRDVLNDYTTLPGKVLNAEGELVDSKPVLRLKAAQTYLEGVQNRTSKKYADYAKAIMPKALTDKFHEIGATPINDLSANELGELNSTLTRYLHQARLYASLTETRKAREMHNFNENAKANIKYGQKKPRGVKDAKRGPAKKVLDFLIGRQNYDASTIGDVVWGRFEPFFGPLIQRGRRQQVAAALKYAGIVKESIARHGITGDQMRTWSKRMGFFTSEIMQEKTNQAPVKHAFEIDGSPVEFTMAELISFYMHTKNRYNLRQIIHNGIGTRDKRQIGKLKKADFIKIMDYIQSDPVAVAFADSLSELYLAMRDDMNLVSVKLDGFEIAQEEDYFHLAYVPEGGVMGVEYARDPVMDEDGRLKSRVGSDQPVLIVDIFEAMSADIGAISEFVGMSEALRKLRALANYLPFRQELRDRGGEDILGSIDKAIKRIQTTKYPLTSMFERAVEALTQNVATATLVNPKIWALQATSVTLYATEMSAEYVTSGFSSNPMLEQDLTANVPMYTGRRAGIGAARTLAAPWNARRLFADKGHSGDALLAPMHTGDIIPFTIAARAVFLEMQDAQREGTSKQWWREVGITPEALEYGTPEYWNAFNDRFDYITTRTQPMFNPESKTELTGSSNTLVRAVFRFRAFIDQLIRIMNRQFYHYKYGQISKAEFLKNTAIAMSNIMVISVLFQLMWDLFRGAVKEPEEYLIQGLTAPLSIMPALGYPLQQIVAKALGSQGNFAPEISVMPLTMVESMLRNSWDIAKGLNYSYDDKLIESGPDRGMWASEKYLKDGGMGITVDILTMMGVPARQINQIKWGDDK